MHEFVQRHGSIRPRNRVWVIADYLQGKPFTPENPPVSIGAKGISADFHTALYIFSRRENLPAPGAYIDNFCVLQPQICKVLLG